MIYYLSVLLKKKNFNNKSFYSFTIDNYFISDLTFIRMFKFFNKNLNLIKIISRVNKNKKKRIEKYSKFCNSYNVIKYYSDK